MAATNSIGSGANKDSRGTLRGACEMPSCTCDGYDGGSELKKCVNCSHPPGRHQNMSTGVSSLRRSILLTPPDLSPPPIDDMSVPPVASVEVAPLMSSGCDSTVLMSPVYQCDYPGCAEETPFDPNTGEQLSPYCDEHHKMAALSYTQLQQSLCSAPQQRSGNTKSATTRGFHLGTSPISLSDSDDEVMDADSAIIPRRVETDSDLLSTSLGQPDGSLFPTPSYRLTSHSVVPRLDGMLKKRKTKKRGRTESVIPPKSPVKAWLPPPRPAAVPQSASTPQLLPTAPAPLPNPPQPTPTAPISVPAPIPVPAPQTNLPTLTPLLNVLPPQQMCKLPGCNRPKYREQDGRLHDFCGRRHAQQFAAAVAPQPVATPTVAPHMLCGTPGCPRQKCPNPDGGYFNYCSRYCRDHGLHPSPSTPNLQDPSGYGTCSLPGCTRPKYCDPANGRVHDFCGRTHAAQARAQGIQPSSQANIRSADSQELATVTQKFTSSWRKGTCPSVYHVFVVSNPALETRWRAYRQKLQNQTVEEYYHGTKLTCNLSQPPCTSNKCGICGISSMGLDRRCIQQNINFQRFGHGFYLAPNSSKCHDYTQGAHGYRAMLLCDVCPGRKYNLMVDNQDMVGPPSGYDSVFGQVGSRLNYAEIVVYNPDAVFPRYIIMYRKDGEHKIAT